MTFQPIIPVTGYSGWLFLERTLEPQEAAFAESPQNLRNTEQFREKIGSVTTAAELVKDRQMLSVALGAFGLDDDIGNTYFIQKILEEGTSSDDALANKLSDTRYAEFSAAFGFGETSAPNTRSTGFADEIIDQYQRAQFEIAVGAQDNDMRLALNTASAISDIASNSSTSDGKWFLVMGNPPLREVFDTALGLPSSFAQLDIDNQLEVYRERTDSIFGSPEVEQFSNPEKQQDLLRMFLLRSQIDSFQETSGGSIALTLLQNSRFSYG